MNTLDYLQEVNAFNETALQRINEADTQDEMAQARDATKETIRDSIVDPIASGLAMKSLASKSIREGIKRFLKTGDEDVDEATESIVDGDNPVDVVSRVGARLGSRITQSARNAIQTVRNRLSNSGETEEGSIADRLNTFTNRVRRTTPEDEEGTELDDLSNTGGNDAPEDATGPEQGADDEMNFDPDDFNADDIQLEDPLSSTFSDAQLDQVQDVLDGVPSTTNLLSEGQFEGLTNLPRVSTQFDNMGIDSGRNISDAFMRSRNDNVQLEQQEAPPESEFDNPEMFPEGSGARVNLSQAEDNEPAEDAPVEDANAVVDSAQRTAGNESQIAETSIDDATNEGLDTGLEAGLETTGEELDTDPITAPLGIVLGLGGLFASIFAGHSHHHTDPQVNLQSTPVFQSNT